MPNFVSKGGEWFPCIEEVALENKSNKDVKYIDANGDEQIAKAKKPFIYNGPDRGAMELLQENGGTLGQHFTKDAELASRVRQHGIYKDVKEYALAMGYDYKKAEEEFLKKAMVVTSHELPDRIEGIKKLGGGVNTAGTGDDKYGDFGEAPNQ